MIVTMYHFTIRSFDKAVSTIVAETEKEERDAKRNPDNVTMDTFIQSTVTTNTSRKKTNVPNEKRISLESLAETIKGFNIFTLQSTIKNSADYHSEKSYAEGDPKSDKVVATHTSDGK